MDKHRGRKMYRNFKSNMHRIYSEEEKKKERRTRRVGQ
jgi:hypothetical protein